MYVDEPDLGKCNLLSEKKTLDIHDKIIRY